MYCIEACKSNHTPFGWIKASCDLPAQSWDPKKGIADARVVQLNLFETRVLIYCEYILRSSKSQTEGSEDNLIWIGSFGAPLKVGDHKDLTSKLGDCCRKCYTCVQGASCHSILITQEINEFQLYSPVTLLVRLVTLPVTGGREHTTRLDL